MVIKGAMLASPLFVIKFIYQGCHHHRVTMVTMRLLCRTFEVKSKCNILYKQFILLVNLYFYTCMFILLTFYKWHKLQLNLRILKKHNSYRKKNCKFKLLKQKYNNPEFSMNACKNS